jgi:serine/threonine protein kinase
MWGKLSHQNVLPFRGVTTTLFQLALVYDWGHSGNITQFVASNPRASRVSLVRNFLATAATTEHRQLFFCVWQLLGVARGLEYLHSLDIPHGDLKGVSYDPSVCFLPLRLQRRDLFLCVLRLCDCANSTVTGERRHRPGRARSFDRLRVGTHQLWSQFHYRGYSRRYWGF